LFVHPLTFTRDNNRLVTGMASGTNETRLSHETRDQWAKVLFHYPKYFKQFQRRLYIHAWLSCSYHFVKKHAWLLKQS